MSGSRPSAPFLYKVASHVKKLPFHSGHYYYYWNIVVVGKSSQNSSKPVLIFWSSIPYVFCLYIQCTLVIVVSYYDLSVLSISDSDGFPKKFAWGWVGGVRSIQVFFFEFC